MKLVGDGPDLTSLASHPLLRDDDATTSLLDTTYLDTADRSLHAAGLSLRLRREGGRTIQTLKSAAPAAIGLFDRGEWESDVAGPEPDLALLADTPAAALLDEAGAHALRPLFRTVIGRSRRAIRHGGSGIVATLDAGRVETDQGDVPLYEVELELADGDPADLFSLAKALGESAPLRLGVLSKGEQGYALIDERLRKPSKAAGFHLDPETPAGDAFAAVAKACLRHLRLNEDVFRHDRAPEALHQMRVALRRLRSAFSLFKPLLEQDETAEKLRAAIKRVTEPFGTARNLDVFLDETLPGEIERRPDEPGLEDLRRRLAGEREEAYAAVFAVLDGPDWRALILDLVVWIETGPWREGKSRERDRSARDFAADVLERLRRRLKKRGRHLARLEPEERHRVRIVAKKLRYGAEFFGPLFPEKKAAKRHKAFVGALSDLQNHLGALNDLSTAHQIADRLVAAGDTGSAEAPTGATLFAAGLTTADVQADARAARLVDKAEGAHGALVDMRPFWR
ncbi:inorganic triphosphatase [Methylobacterium gnaphalii]|uniref:Inorganic triphosphatase n=1 Tax=Methylobacterium gnaphalii TaxID=1010610 RepID=A0A512JGP3_9HYPH|nr:inorganic triphosphatase [Methylobacterium gnaphalii]